jgi:pyruvate formate lyase activating enzyme
MKGKAIAVGELVRELKKDAITFRRSGGGVTISGGEPLVQAEFLLELLKACKEQGWHTAMETTGLARESVIERVFPWVDLVLLDIKAIAPDIHKANTGVSNEIILENSIAISNIAPTVVRVPTIPGVNSTISEYRAICSHVKSMNGVDTIHILPYHTYGVNKYGLIGKEYPLTEVPPLTKDEIANLKKLVEDEGFKCVIGG